MKMRRGEIRFVTYPQPEVYTGPLVVLVDEGTASTSEIFAGALQESGRAVVVGEPSLGAVLPSVVEKLPNGAIFQYPVADFKTPKGVLLEGRGVKPDVDVLLVRADFLAGRDPALDAALAYLVRKGIASR
jgi:carboxyl-terminal processing protease